MCRLPGAASMPLHLFICVHCARSRTSVLSATWPPAADLHQVQPAGTGSTAPVRGAWHLEHRHNQKAQLPQHLQGPVVHPATSMGAPAMLHTCLLWMPTHSFVPGMSKACEGSSLALKLPLPVPMLLLMHTYGQPLRCQLSPRHSRPAAARTAPAAPLAAWTH